MFQYIVIEVIFILAIWYLAQVFIKTFSGGLKCKRACSCGGRNVNEKKGSGRKN